MKVTSDILQQEFIGTYAKVEESTNSSLLGISGRVVDESKNTLVIQHENRNKAIAKGITVFRFTMSDGTIVEINGRMIVGRPEDRVKKRIRRRW
jgi:ribonuclease P protein subunit POP4